MRAERLLRAAARRAALKAEKPKLDRIDTYSEFKRSVVEPDFREFMANKADLRKAWHCAGSLFHLHDWVYAAHKASIDSKYKFVGDDGERKPIACAAHFATSLGQTACSTLPEPELHRSKYQASV